KTSTVYVLGSVHLMKKEVYPLNNKIEDAFEKSNILAVEANINDAAKLDLQKLLTSAFYPGNETLEKHVSKETYELVKKETGSMGMPLELINNHTLKDLKILKQEIDKLLQAWLTGDAKGIESIASRVNGDRRIARIYEKLYYERNANMTSMIEEFLKTNESYFVVVGAGHLVGNKGIIELLKRKGYHVEQI
ncbi:MAG: TraB/GumN family protein, partial [Nitrospirae bacterium]|nr:TraB/GumN family protein [Nitrospirota bacterium]